MAITIATWNVNSVKSRLHILLPWLKQESPDIVLLQETKTLNEGFPAMEIEELGYNIIMSGQKSYNGVAILSKCPLEDIRLALPGDEADSAARYIEAVVSLPGSAIRVSSVYVPNGQAVDSEKFPYKLAFMDRLKAHASELLKLEEMLVLGGDYNIAPEPIDVYDPAKMAGKICYHPLERERAHALMHVGLYDAFRTLHPAHQSFSWWDYRAGAFEGGLGLRIDYLLLSAQAMDRLTSCEIASNLRTLERPSDHAPVLCTLSS